MPAADWGEGEIGNKCTFTSSPNWKGRPWWMKPDPSAARLQNWHKIKRVIEVIVTSVGLIGGRLQAFLATLWHNPGPKLSFWVYRPDDEARSALCLPVLPQMIWQGQHWSQHLRMPGLLTLCTPLSWLQASLMQPSLTQQLLLLPRPCTPRWGTNRCVYLLPSLLFPPQTPVEDIGRCAALLHWRCDLISYCWDRIVKQRG